MVFIKRMQIGWKAAVAATVFTAFLSLGLEGLARAKPPALPALPRLPRACFQTSPSGEEGWKEQARAFGYRHTKISCRKNFNREELGIMFERVDGKRQPRRLKFTVCEDDKPPPPPDPVKCERARQEWEGTPERQRTTGVFDRWKACDFDQMDCTPENGERNMADLIRGKVAVLMFTLGACQPCNVMKPEFQALHDRFAGREGFASFTIIAGDYGPQRSRHALRIPDRFPVVREDDSQDYRQVNDGYPTILITNKQGEVVAAFAATCVNLQCQGIIDMIEHLLAEPATQAIQTP